MDNTTPLESLEGYIWLNGKFIPWEEAKIHILNHNMHYSGSVFEGIKARDTKIFRIEDHIKRLYNSAKQFEMKIPFEISELIEAANQLLDKNNLKDCYIRPLVWRSTRTLKVEPVNEKINVMIAAWKPFGKKSQDKLKLNISNFIKPTEEMHPVQCKAASQYAIYSMVIREAIKKGFNDSIMLDSKGFISECSTTNIFFIKGDEIHTPTTRNCLAGITRKTVLEIANKKNFKFIEKDISTDEIKNYNACITTGTAFGIREVESISLCNEIVKFQNSDISNIIINEYEKLLRN